MRVRTEAKRQDILQIAGAMFLAEGFGAVSMSRIAAAVGGSKATLYGYFPSKETLFAAFVAQSLDAVSGNPADLADLSAALTQAGRRYLRHALTPTVLALNRMVIGEAARFPDLGQLFFENGPRRTTDHMRRLFQRLATLHALPALTRPRAALQFKSLCDAGLYERHIWGVATRPTDDEIDQTIAEAVAVFLAAYRPRTDR